MQNKMPQKRPAPTFGVGDEIAYALASGVRYGHVVRVIGAGDQASIDVEFEDGGREVHRVKDRALSLLRRVSGESAMQEEMRDRKRLHDPDVDAARKSDIRRGRH